jgi:hypothetical protein
MELVVELDESLMFVMADMNSKCNEYRTNGVGIRMMSRGKVSTGIKHDLRLV